MWVVGRSQDGILHQRPPFSTAARWGTKLIRNILASRLSSVSCDKGSCIHRQGILHQLSGVSLPQNSLCLLIRQPNGMGATDSSPHGWGAKHMEIKQSPKARTVRGLQDCLSILPEKA